MQGWGWILMLRKWHQNLHLCARECSHICALPPPHRKERLGISFKKKKSKKRGRDGRKWFNVGTSGYRGKTWRAWLHHQKGVLHFCSHGIYKGPSVRTLRLSTWLAVRNQFLIYSTCCGWFAQRLPDPWRVIAVFGKPLTKKYAASHRSVCSHFWSGRRRRKGCGFCVLDAFNACRFRIRKREPPIVT